MDKLKLSKLLAALSAVLVFTMIFINFASGLSCNGEGFGMMVGKPSLFNLMFGGYEGFKENTNGILHYMNAVSGLTVAFAFEIVATVLLVVVLVSHFFGKANSKIVALISFLGLAFVLTSTILTFSTKSMTYQTIITQLSDQSSGKVITDIIKNTFANNMKLGTGAIINGILGILVIGSAVASRYILKKGNNAQ